MNTTDTPSHAHLATQLAEPQADGAALNPPSAAQIDEAAYAWTAADDAAFEAMLRQHLADEQEAAAYAGPAGAPIVFLDIDDVICINDRYDGHCVLDVFAGRRLDAETVFAGLFHQPAVEVLRAVHIAMGGRIRYVISSTWREYFTRTQLREVFLGGGLNFVADNLEHPHQWRTPSLGRDRRLEIAAWLVIHGHDEPYVVLDDKISGDSFLGRTATSEYEIDHRVVLCELKEGLKPEHCERIVQLLRRPF